MLAVEVGMQFVRLAMTIVGADGILQHPRAIGNAMYQVMGKEKHHRTEDGRFIDRLERAFQFRERDGMVRVQHRLQYQQTDGCRLHTPRLQLLD